MAFHPWGFWTDCFRCHGPLTIFSPAIILIFDFFSSQPFLQRKLPIVGSTERWYLLLPKECQKNELWSKEWHEKEFITVHTNFGDNHEKFFWQLGSSPQDPREIPFLLLGRIVCVYLIDYCRVVLHCMRSKKRRTSTRVFIVPIFNIHEIRSGCRPRNEPSTQIA